MIYFKPIDEMSLRHLFASDLGESVLKMSYVGPVLNPSGSVESSPDCIILDERSGSWKLKKCEFKYMPNSKEEFERNGNFDIAIIWSLSNPSSREKLKEDLLKQNSCQEIIILSDFIEFNRLPEYQIINDIKEIHDSNELRKKLIDLTRPAIYCAYIAAAIYPKKFNIDIMSKFLSSRFEELQKMNPKGKGSSIVGALQQKNLLKKMDRNNYRWDENINHNLAIGDITYILTDRVGMVIPDSDIIDKFNKADLY